MHDLKPFFQLYRNHWLGLSTGVLLGLITTLASIGLLTLSGWFITASAMAGILAITNFNFMLPAAGVRGFSITRTAGRWAERVVSHDATFKVLADLRIYFFNRLVPLIPGTLKTVRDADLLNRLIADISAMDHIYLRLISPIIIGFIGIASLCGFVSYFSISIGFTLGSVLLTLFLSLPIFFHRLGLPHGIQITEKKSQFRVHLLDWLSGNTELTIFGVENKYQSKCFDAEASLFQAQRNMETISAFSIASLVIANGFTVVLILWLAAGSALQTTAPPLVAMVVFATMASFELMAPVATAFQYLSQTRTSAKRLNEILHAAPEVVFEINGHQANVRGDIHFHNVGFSYESTFAPVLQDVNVTIQSGEKIGLIGKTGCGKSTLLQLLTRHWDITQGEISIDQVPLKKWQESSLRAAISVVSQRVDILNGTLRTNLQLARPEGSDDAFAKTLSHVGLGSLLSGHGLNTWLGDGGRQLSGGERRRIGVARALLHDAPILLLDEPTEGLDVATEAMILNQLFEHARHKTIIFVTHRMTHLEQMDRIYLMENGHMIQAPQE